MILNTYRIQNVSKQVPSILNSVYSNDLEIFPNPAKNKLSLFVSKGKGVVSIFTASYRLIYTKNIDYPNDAVLELSLEHMSNGVYLVRVAGDNGVGIKKFIVMK